MVVAREAGPSQAAFDDRTLKRYDWLLEFTCNRVWRCPIDRTLELYQQHLSPRAFMRLYNARKVFCNLEDSLAGLREALEGTFQGVEIAVIGCVAQFSARA
jgi:hypothetical protein